MAALLSVAQLGENGFVDSCLRIHKTLQVVRVSLLQSILLCLKGLDARVVGNAGEGSGEDDGLVGVGEDAVVEVPLHGAG
jgi:hypothetical protein